MNQRNQSISPPKQFPGSITDISLLPQSIHSKQSQPFKYFDKNCVGFISTTSFSLISPCKHVSRGVLISKLINGGATFFGVTSLPPSEASILYTTLCCQAEILMFFD